MSSVAARAVPKIVLCAGQACVDREGCARYRVRGGDFPWVSWDIERQGREGPCPAIVSFNQGQKRSR